MQHTFFNTVLCRHSMTTMWNSLTGRFMEQKDINTPPLDYEQSLFFLSPCSDTRKWPSAWLKARDVRVRALPSLNLKKKSTPSRVFLSSSKLRFGPQELNFSEIYLVHLAFQESWNNRDKLWNNAKAFNTDVFAAFPILWYRNRNGSRVFYSLNEEMKRTEEINAWKGRK